MGLRIYELAKEFGVDSKRVIEVLKDKGENVKSHLSSVDADIGRRIIQETIVDAVEDAVVEAVEDKIVEAAKKVEDKIDEITLPISDFVPDIVEEAIEDAIEGVVEETVDIATEVIEEAVDEVVEEVTESVEGFNERRKQEIIAEKMQIEKREMLERARIDKEDRLSRLESGRGFFAWLFSLFSNRK